LVELKSSSDARSLICSSRTSVTSVSTVPGVAPSRIVVTVTIGYSMRGKKSTPTRPNEIQPSATSALQSMTAKTGFRTETSEIHMRSPNGDRRAVNQSWERGADEHSLTGNEPRDHLQATRIEVANLHASLDRETTLRDEDVTIGLVAEYRSTFDHERRLRI